jgi:hypothetical protein
MCAYIKSECDHSLISINKQLFRSIRSCLIHFYDDFDFVFYFKNNKLLLNIYIYNIK